VAAVDTDTSEGRVYVFDTASHQRLREQPEVVGDDPRDLAVTPDGRWALVVSAAVDAVSVLDAARMRLENTLFLPKPAGASLVPVAVEVSPNGRRAFVANENNQSVSVIDLATWEVSEAIIIAQAPESTIDMAVTPSGDRLYIGLATATLDSTGLFFLPLGRQLPDDWTLTQGFVFALPYGDPYHLTAAFGPVTQEERSARPARPSALSQVTAVTGGCSYDFSFWGIASDANAVAEVIWRGDACSLQRVDRVPIQIVERSAERQVEPGLTNRQAVASALPELRLHRARWQAPAGATQAEIRFIIPAEQNAIADTVSFQATAEAVANGDLLHENEDGEVTGWQVMPATAVGFTVLPDEAGTQLANMGSQAVALVQSFPVTAGQPFILLFQGEMVSQLAAREPARVELRWLDAQDAPTVNVTTLTIQPGETEHRRQETVPTAAAGAELHLVIPAGSTLVARQISFAPVELVTVPIQFLAQAPGDLTVTGFRVAYDVSETAAAPAPAEGLCQPTPPGRRPDGQPGCICPWCPTPCDACDEDSAIGHPQPTPVPGPVRAITQPRRTTRPLRVTQPAVAAVVPAVPPIQPVETAIAALIVATPAEWAVRAPELAAASVPLAAINGIGAERMVALAGLGIDSIPRLAAAEPESIAALQGVSVNMARAFVAEAQAMVANPETLPAPLVSCIMPTYNRRHFVAKAIELFQRQEYPNRELIILDDGDEPVEDLAPDDETIRYVRLAERQSIGQKRNIGCQAARGPIIAHWDDDVWVAPWRLSYQVAALIENEADLCGLDNLLHYDLLTGQAWHSVRPPGREPWLPGNTFCYRKSLWQERPFGDRSVGSDIAFLRQRPGAKSVALQAITWLVDIIHGQNASPKDGRNPLWRPYPVAEIQQLLGEDWAFYVQLGQKNPIGTDGR
jgi:YVTN family beta-propeller protein